MADGSRQGIGRIRGHRPIELQDASHHELHLSLLGAARSDHRLLDLPRRVLEHLGVGVDGAADRRSPCLSELQRTVGIAIDEHPLDGDLLRPVLRHDSANAGEYLTQARREFAVRRAYHAARHIREPRPQGVHDSKAGALRPRIDAEYPYGRGLKRQASSPRTVEWRSLSSIPASA